MAMITANRIITEAVTHFLTFINRSLLRPEIDAFQTTLLFEISEISVDKARYFLYDAKIKNLRTQDFQSMMMKILRGY